jgi:undecaprenyl-diphosphatase
MNISRRIAVVASALLAIFAVCALFGGGDGGVDSMVAAQAADIRASSPFLLHVALLVTQLGSASATLGAAALGALVLAIRRDHGRLLILLVTVLLARFAVEGLKLGLGRVRPTFDTQMVQVHSLSFPSAHAANSMTTYGLLAGLLIVGRWRPAAISLAVGLAIVIGLTRILIGVHWLSDVVGGWAAGGLAVTVALAAGRNRLAAQEQ